MLVKPKETVNLIKRFMGGTYDEVKDAISHIQYDVKNVNGSPRISVNGREYSPEEISSYILAKMKKIAEDYVGSEIKDAVITVPAFFSDAAKAATKQAGELAGLNVLRIISEPTAAILSSNIDKVKGGKYMVVDFGGSTLDFSVADIADNVIEILASYGDVYCGGTDIDKILTDYILEEFKKENGVDISKDSMALTRINEAAEKAKIELSNSTVSEVNLPYLTVKDNVPVHMMMKITKAKLEQLIDKTLDHVIECGKEALKKSGLDAKDLDGILLVGGSCRIPYLQEKLINAFGDKLIKSSNLDLAVAEGAAIQANILANGSGENDILLLDVVPLTLGIETEGGVMTPVVEANTTIPCKREQIFSTAVDNQPSVTINVLNGERPMAKDNKVIGLFTLDGIMPAKRGVPKIKVSFDVDANGILTVTAKDEATGKEQHVTIENNNTLSQEEIDRIKKEAQEHAVEDAKIRQEQEKANKCESVIYQTESQMENMKDYLTEDDKAFFNGKIEELKKIKESKDFTNLDDIVNETNQRWYSISAKAYGTQGQQSADGSQSVDPNVFNQMFGSNNPFANGFNANSQNTKKDDVEEV